MENNNKIATIEAILFINSSHISIKKLAKFINVSKKDMESLIGDLKEKLDDNYSGITLIQNNDNVSLVSKAEFSELLEKFTKEKIQEELTKPAIETLSIISYFGPISRAKIDYIRGVNSTYMLRSLLIRGLINRIEMKNMYVYEPSMDLLKYIGISNRKELPNFDEYSKKMLELFSDDELSNNSIKVEQNINIDNNK